MSQYKVLFLGLAVAGPEEEVRLLRGLEKKFGLSQERAERLLQRVPIVVKKGMSKEEMERYMRAFQEVGGRVRLEEEEPIPESQEVGETPEPEKEPAAGKMITCPQCAFEQPETNQCVKCGLDLSASPAYQERDTSFETERGGTPSEENVNPWETGEGFVGAFLKTMKNALFSPTRFFRKGKPANGIGPSLLYALIAGIIGLGGSGFWQWVLFSRMFHYKIASSLPYSIHLTLITIALPLMVLFSIAVGSGVTHFCLIIVGGNKTGFRTTFRSVAYAYSGHLFGIIPFIGSTIGSFYTLILTIIGVKEGHGISTGRAVFAVLLPFILLAGLGIIAAIFIPLFLGSIRIFGGVGV